MSDADLLTAAIDAAGLSARRFAVEVLAVDERTVRRWLAGRELSGPVRALCGLVVAAPELVPLLREIVGPQRGA